MRRLNPTRALPLLITSCFALWHCGASDEAVAQGGADLDANEAPANPRGELDGAAALEPRESVGAESAPAPQASCRQMVASARVVVAGVTGQQACEFDVAALRHVCRTELEDGTGETLTVAYASVADFVEAGLHAGKITSLGAVHRGAHGETRVEYFYDELGRLTRSVATSARGDLVRRYADYDDDGRPRREWLAGDGVEGLGCAGQPLVLQYDDDAHGVTRRAEAQDVACASIGDALERHDVLARAGLISAASTVGVAFVSADVDVTPSRLVTVCE
jgi:hypothetical protein